MVKSSNLNLKLKGKTALAAEAGITNYWSGNLTMTLPNTVSGTAITGGSANVHYDYVGASILGATGTFNAKKKLVPWTC